MRIKINRIEEMNLILNLYGHDVRALRTEPTPKTKTEKIERKIERGTTDYTDGRGKRYDCVGAIHELSNIVKRKLSESGFAGLTRLP